MKIYEGTGGRIYRVLEGKYNPSKRKNHIGKFRTHVAKKDKADDRDNWHSSLSRDLPWRNTPEEAEKDLAIFALGEQWTLLGEEEDSLKGIAAHSYRSDFGRTYRVNKCDKGYRAMWKWHDGWYRVKSLPERLTFERAQADLDQYADLHELRIVT